MARTTENDIRRNLIFELDGMSSSGSHQVLQSWVRDHWEWLLSVAEEYRGRATTAQDIVLEALWLAYRKRHSLRYQGATRSWLTGFVRNVGRKAVDKRRRRRRLALRLPMPEAAKSPHELVDERSLAEALARAVAHLPEPQRSVVVLRLDGLSYREIALRLELPLGTVKSHRARALPNLRRLMAAEGFRSAR